jgi:hypothetical protein
MKITFILTMLLSLQATALTKTPLDESDRCFRKALAIGLNILNEEARVNNAYWKKIGYDYDRCKWESHYAMIECWKGDSVTFEMVFSDNSATEKVTPTLKRKWFEFIFNSQGQDLILEIMFEETPKEACRYNHGDLTAVDDGEE